MKKSLKKGIMNRSNFKNIITKIELMKIVQSSRNRNFCVNIFRKAKKQ